VTHSMLAAPSTRSSRPRFPRLHARQSADRLIETMAAAVSAAQDTCTASDSRASSPPRRPWRRRAAPDRRCTDREIRSDRCRVQPAGAFERRDIDRKRPPLIPKACMRAGYPWRANVRRWRVVRRAGGRPPGGGQRRGQLRAQGAAVRSGDSSPASSVPAPGAVRAALRPRSGACARAPRWRHRRSMASARCGSMSSASGIAAGCGRPP